MIDTPKFNTLSYKASELKAKGITSVAGYFFSDSQYKEHPTHASCLRYAADGISVRFCCENGYPNLDGYNSGYFTTSKGNNNAIMSINDAKIVLLPKGEPIFTTIDFDANETHWPEIQKYLAAFQQTIKGAGYLMGVYGNGVVLRLALAAGLTSHTWLAGSTGWGEYAPFKAKATIVQTEMNAMLLGSPVDYSVSKDAGGWISK
jgi:hypothetical protein